MTPLSWKKRENKEEKREKKIGNVFFFFFRYQITPSQQPSTQEAKD